MNPIRRIRERLGVTQSSLAETLGVTQGNVAHYEKGQTVPPDVAKKLISAARLMGHIVTYEDVYGPVSAPITPEIAQRIGRRKTDKVSL